MTAPATPPKKTPPEPYVDHAEYASLRLIQPTGDGGRMHGGSGVPTLIQGGPGRCIVLSSRGPYFTFRIRETGLEIPVTNVASATPRGAPAAGNRRRPAAEAIEKRREERLAKAAKRNEEAAVRAEEAVKQKAAARAEKAKARAARKATWNDDPEDLDG